MAGEEDVELRDLVAHTLETKGVLGKIRASFYKFCSNDLGVERFSLTDQHILYCSMF